MYIAPSTPKTCPVISLARAEHQNAGRSVAIGAGTTRPGHPRARALADTLEGSAQRRPARDVDLIGHRRDALIAQFGPGILGGVVANDQRNPVAFGHQPLGDAAPVETADRFTVEVPLPCSLLLSDRSAFRGRCLVRLPEG